LNCVLKNFTQAGHEILVN